MLRHYDNDGQAPAISTAEQSTSRNHHLSHVAGPTFKRSNRSATIELEGCQRFESTSVFSD
jgi:hypothetical protein